MADSRSQPNAVYTSGSGARRINSRRLFPLTSRLMDVVFPPHCDLCENDPRQKGGRTPLCDNCLEYFCPTGRTCCPRCAGPLARVSVNCHYCQKRNYRFDRALALGPYQNKLRETVLLMKRPEHESLTAKVGHLIAENIRQHGWDQQVEIVTSRANALGHGGGDAA